MLAGSFMFTKCNLLFSLKNSQDESYFFGDDATLQISFVSVLWKRVIFINSLPWKIFLNHKYFFRDFWTCPTWTLPFKNTVKHGVKKTRSWSLIEKKAFGQTKLKCREMDQITGGIIIKWFCLPLCIQPSFGIRDFLCIVFVFVHHALRHRLNDRERKT